MQKRKKGFAVFTQRLEKMQEKPLMSHLVDVCFTSGPGTVSQRNCGKYEHTLALFTHVKSILFLFFYAVL